jgi:hypothetical protein
MPVQCPRVGAPSDHRGDVEPLFKCWGKQYARAVCRLEMNITDEDEVANAQLRREMENTAVYQSGVIHVARPYLEK